MLFNSFEFAVFFLAFFALYMLVRRRVFARNLLILAASYFFYCAWDVRFMQLIVVSTAVDYAAALMIDRGRIPILHRLGISLYVVAGAVGFVGFGGHLLSDGDLSSSGALIAGCVGATILFNLAYPLLTRLSENARRRSVLVASIVVNLGILATFKYFDFFADSFSRMVSGVFGTEPSDWTVGFVLPVGISFYTFQTMSYSIDVFRRKTSASSRFVDVAAYIAFFPQLVAGPIERASQLLPQFHEVRPPLDLDRFRRGAWLIVWGLFKKVVVADNMAVVVNATFGPYDQGGTAVPADGLTLLVALYAFALQIYGDFSGYTDIARGISKLLGFDLMRNFDLPYFATSPSDFWRRWHISLSSWLRDYLYIPLGGNKGGPWFTYRNLTITMLLGGLWHGAAWNFVIWGAYHGVLLSIYRALGVRTEEGAYPRPVILLLGLLMFHLTCIGWLLFRAQNVGTIVVFLEGIFLNPIASEQTWTDLAQVVKFGWFLVLFQIAQAVTRTQDPMRRWHWFVRLNIWIFIVMSLFALSARGSQEFIYFAF